MSVRLPESLRVLLTRKMLICVFTGFSSGLPLYLLLNLLPAWMRSEGVDLKTIGFFALIQFPYTWKFLWSPFLDRYAVPLLGRRRGWTFLMQIGLLLTIGSLGGLSPTANITPVLWLAALLALFSATQDIALDAYRRELLADVELGLGTAVHVKSDSGDKVYRGQIGFISPRAEFTPKTVETTDLRTDLVYRLRIVIDEADSDAALRQGMPVTIAVDAKPASSTRVGER